MKRPIGWPANPQAMAAASLQRQYEGHPDLGTDVDRDTWLTPRYILEEVGPFDLDPCAADACPDRCALNFWRKADDGLNRTWTGRVFMNPPFSDSRPWIIRHAHHANGISLLAVSVESRVWRACVWKSAKAVLLLHGRTRFCNPDGTSTTGRPLRSIALVAWSDYDAEVLAKCRLPGVLLRSWIQR